MLEPLSRRQVLSAAAATAPLMLLPLHALAGRAPANARIGVGFIGCGKRMFEMLGPYLNHAETQVLAVCDVDTTRRTHAKKLTDDHYAKSGGKNDCAAFVDYRELLAMKGIDAVVIATPDHWHAAQIIDSAKAGKDIYCEKPMTLTIAEAKACIDAVRKADRVFQTGSQQRTEFDGVFVKACEYLRSSRIGKILHAHIGVGESSKPCDLPEESMEAGLDWDRWLGPAPKRPYNSILSPRGVHSNYPNWRLYKEYSGGMMTDFGAHHFDICQWALGMDESGPVEILPPLDPKAMYGCTLVYPNGTHVHHGGPFGGTYIGENGVIHVTRGWTDCMPKEIYAKPLGDGDVKLPRAKSHIDNFIECVRSRKRCICDVEVGGRSVTVCHLANLAYWHRKRLRWDPKAWQFLTADGKPDTEANAWLDYARRPGYELPKI